MSKDRIIDKIRNNKMLQNAVLSGSFLVLSVLYLFLFSRNTSYLYQWSDGDGAIYWATGRFMKKGMIPYIDFFDHKGPLIFFIEFVGNLISYDRIGIFLVQVVFMFCSIWGIFKIYLLFYELKKSLKMTALSMLLINLFYAGNLTEEYCLPFLLWSTYFAVKFFKSYKDREEVHNPLYAFFYGITFMVCFLIRLTSALPMCCVVMVIFFYLVYHKRWKNIIQNIFMFCLGSVITILPFIIYFWWHGALYQMFDAAFLHNITYVTANDNIVMNGSGWYVFYNMFIFIISISIGMLSLIFDAENRLISESVLLMGGIGSWLQLNLHGYEHYYLIWIPMIILALGLIKNLLGKKNSVFWVTKIIVDILIIYTLSINLLITYSDILDLQNVKKFTLVSDAEEIGEYIPQEDKDNILAYNVDSYFYIVTDTLPCIKYFMLQDEIGEYSEETRNAFTSELRTGKAKYIVIQRESENRMDTFIKENYEIVHENKSLTLLKRKE